METKICRGPRHPEGIELPIEDFYTRSRGGYQYFCKKCEWFNLKSWQEANPEKFKEAKIRNIRTYYERHPNKQSERILKQYYANGGYIHQKDKLKKSYDKRSKNLSHSYVRFIWNRRFKRKGQIPPEFTNDIWLAESIRIQTIRKNKKLKPKL